MLLHSPHPVLLLSLVHLRIRRVSAGGLHSLALTDDLRVLAWGAGGSGQLGHGGDHGGHVIHDVFLPMPVDVFDRHPRNRSKLPQRPVSASDGAYVVAPAQAAKAAVGATGVFERVPYTPIIEVSAGYAHSLVRTAVLQLPIQGNPC